MSTTLKLDSAVTGEFVTLAGERFYAIRNCHNMAPFFVSVVSASDHWLFASSTGGLTAGRVSPDTALFPYVTVDKVHDSSVHTGSKTLLRVNINSNSFEWEPFNREHDGLYHIERNLYKNILGNKLCFEEVNHDLEVLFRYTWSSSDSYGFVRHSELENLSDKNIQIDILDGLQNILPAGTPSFIQTNSSNLVDAYKWNELDQQTGLAMFTVYSAITDRAEPCESLKANSVFCLGLKGHKVLVSSGQLKKFRLGNPIEVETQKRGVRGAYLINHKVELKPRAFEQWQLVANIEQSQSQVVELRRQLGNPREVSDAIAESVSNGSDRLARIMASGDAFQLLAEENVSVHHYANVLFNILRGGTFDDQYNISSRDFSNTIKHFNVEIYQQHQAFFEGLPELMDFHELLASVKQQDDLRLERLCYEYLPITFGRRHGDPSRPWNKFSIKLKDESGNRLLTYQGNWRDIFQNWEALALSYPEFTENVIAKFVNASTMDGYNPYRITKEGIDWEVEEPDDPWSFIGYWGDHQIIYLLKLLEISRNFNPDRLAQLLRRPIFSYANVPYRIKPFEALLQDAKSTVEFDEDLAQLIEQRVSDMGADGKLVLDSNGQVYQVNLFEKLMVPLLCKLGNLVIDGGIWMNTQRPEWNDANNALVGQGLSMVTLYYLRRYITFLQVFLKEETDAVFITREVSEWIDETGFALSDAVSLLDTGPLSETNRFKSLSSLGEAASRYRQAVFAQATRTTVAVYPLQPVKTLLENAVIVIDHSIQQNRREDGLYHAYNLLDLQQDSIVIENLYPMLEGQVSALSAGAIKPDQAVILLNALFASEVYRPDQHTFMLYPDRPLAGFLQKNIIPAEQFESIPLLVKMFKDGDESIVLQDMDGYYRFNADIINAGSLEERLSALKSCYAEDLNAARQPLLKLYEQVFNHQAFTGRSGGMFGFEGLGCIYWHMVSKLLLAVQENYFSALDQHTDEATCQELGRLYYRVRKGIGFNKTPSEYGAFPLDPYSHTPKHAGARQPGMTGQVKEEILTRFGELGIRVREGMVHFSPHLLRAQEFIQQPRLLRYLDVNNDWKEINVLSNGLAFTWCQVPIVYRVDDNASPGLTVTWDNGEKQHLQDGILPREDSCQLFKRTGRITQLKLIINSEQLFSENL